VSGSPFLAVVVVGAMVSIPIMTHKWSQPFPFYKELVRKKMNIDPFSACGLAECGILHVLAFRTGADSTSHAFHPIVVWGMDISINFQNGQIKTRFPGRLSKTIVEEKEVEKIVGDEDTQDNALKASLSLFSSDISTLLTQSGEIFLTFHEFRSIFQSNRHFHLTLVNPMT
jgi:hypothetical protein